MLQWAKENKDWTIKQWSKVLSTDESKFEIFGSNKRVYVWWRFGERIATSCITPTVKHGGGSVMVWGCFCQLQSQGFATNFIRSAITAYCSIMWSHLECGLWVKDFYSCKMMTQNILVNSARGTLKAKRNSTSLNWCLGQRNQWT